MNDTMRKRNLKKKVAFLLALSMMSGFASGINANAFSDPDEAAATESSDIAEIEPYIADEKTEAEEIGKINVSFGSGLIIDNDIDFNVTLTNNDGFFQSEIISIGNTIEDKISFDNLADGEYTLKVEADGFASYVQNITVEKKMYSLRITTGFCGGYSYEEGSLHPGVIMIGDVDNDGDIDDDDKNILIDAIDGRSIPENCVTDLNFDGLTNLVDLMFFSKSYKENKDTIAAIEEFVSPFAIKAEVSESTVLDGSVEKMLNGEEKISLQPSNNEEISKENPISLTLDLEEENGASVVDGITIKTGSENPVAEALINVTYIDENGEEQSEDVPLANEVHMLLKESNVYADIDANGNIQVHLGKQVAVKKVVLTVTAMQNNNNLAEISKVEFVNGMENRIPEPEMDIPEKFTAKPASQQFTLNWEPCVNVTGYEVKIESAGISETVLTSSNSLTVSSFGKKELKNYTTYTVSVQSINGEWRSGYCDSVEVTPTPSGPPDKPDGVSATGNYKSISVSWKNMDDTLSYSVYYKLRDSDEEYTKISDIKENKYTILELEDITEYEIYVTGSNELGESPASIHTLAKTKDLNPAEVPRYKMICRNENGVPNSDHIVSAVIGSGFMVDSEQDTDSSFSAWGTVDRNAASYYQKNDWDDGCSYYGTNKGLTYTFDEAYEMDTITLISAQNASYSNVRIKCWNENTEIANFNANISSMRDAEGRPYQVITFPQKVKADKIQICLTTGWVRLIAVSEVYFYHYDPLKDEIMGLYEDDLHTVLREDVTQETIDDLREKVNTPDEFGEENPGKVSLMRELETAEKILNDESIGNSVEVHCDLKAESNKTGGLNAWQPLGVSLAAGDEITIYVGNDKLRTGDQSQLRVIFTQYHSESGDVTYNGANLKVGPNTFSVSKNKLIADAENGGAVYIQYQGNNANDKYAVRVSGGAAVPRLDLYQVTDENERMQKTVAYVKELEKHVAEMEALHNELHKNSGNRNVDMNYDVRNCILGASDIMLDTMMFSLPAPQILAGLGNGTSEEKAEVLLGSIKSMDDMMYLFYQHKGFNDSAPAAINQIPNGHQNIRYQRMFSGAFMYASGNHIGIEWNETRGMVNCTPVVADEDGKYISGRYFGWGIAHEIGHCINQGSYAVAEITNNYFAQLAQAKDTNTGMRFKYDNIYSKVTSGTKGNCSNIATQLGMYWQLHLAYDNGRNYKTYSDYNEQFDNLFYARVDTYSRNPNAAPAPNGVKLVLNGGTDQNLMRLACAAANKNVLEFFERWGKEPNEATIEYAEQFEKETRAIFYANDDSRIYALNGKGSVLDNKGSISAIKNVSVGIGAAANQVELKFTPENIPENDILGYEVIRCTISGGKVEEIPVGFAEGSEFIDTVTTMNNRAVFYKITLIDKYLNRSETVTTNSVKVEHDGSMDKTYWSINTKDLTADAIVNESTDEMPCEQTVSNPAEQAIDHDLKTVYTPQVNSDSAEIVINFNQTLTATGMKYTVGDGLSVGEYEIYVMENNEWVLTAEGKFKGSETVYFANDDNKYISTFSATAVKLVILNQKNTTVSISEIDVLGATGDNVDFRRAGEEKSVVIGTLGKEYRYSPEPDDVIPKDSLIFTGAYKGNPAYNTVILYDKNGNIVGGYDEENNIKAQQIILADVPDSGNIANVSDGTWIYWIEPEQMDNMTIPKNVRAELYRVNNALTNEGQRLVSDTLFESVPEELPIITIDAD